ncbi:MAG: YfcE family phosphodiesterase [Clostridia bacterium]
MKILVIGDTHGQLNKIREIFPKLTNLDLIAHTGDHLEDSALEREFGIPVVAVKGNCDGSYECNDFEINRPTGRILRMVICRTSYRLDNLYYKAMEENCKAVFFGHTHKALVTEEDGIYLVNPGSLSQPRDDSDGSYAIVRTSPDSFEASIVYYSTIMGSGNKNRPRAGYIRSILNYSDRF